LTAGRAEPCTNCFRDNATNDENDFTAGVQLHPAIHHITEQRFAVLRANRDEIRTLLRMMWNISAC
jgi:hypothetical protein